MIVFLSLFVFHFTFLNPTSSVSECLLLKYYALMQIPYIF